MRWLPSNQISAPSLTTPPSGRSRPAIALSVVDLPAPDGPNRMVTPGRATNFTCKLRRATCTSISKDSGTAHRRQLVDQPQRDDRDRGQDRHHAGRLRLAVGLDRVV